jgi:hypothetical protein
MGRRTSQHGRFPFLFEDKTLCCACCVYGLGSGEAVGRGESGSHFKNSFFEYDCDEDDDDEVKGEGFYRFFSLLSISQPAATLSTAHAHPEASRTCCCYSFQ